MKKRLHLGIAAVFLAFAFGGTAIAQTFPELQQTGGQPKSSNALVTINLPAVVGIDVEHNFILNLASNGCWGAGAAFPNLGGGATSYTFAVNTAQIASSADVGCVATTGGGQSDVATIKVFSTASATSTLKCQITDGGFGTSSGTKFSDLVPDIWTGSKLSLILNAGATCGGGTTSAFPVTLAAAATPYTLVTAIPATPFSTCSQKLQLVMNADTTAYKAGIATGKLTYTISTP